MNSIVSKLDQMIIQSHLAYAFFNSYLTKSSYFECRIIKISENQEKALKRINKVAFLRKVELSEKFPRVVLYSRKAVLGLGLMKLSTIIETLVLKQYFSYQQSSIELAILIQTNNEMIHIEKGFNSYPTKIKERCNNSLEK